MNSSLPEVQVQVIYLHRIPNMQLISFNELADFDLKHGNTEYTETEN